MLIATIFKQRSLVVIELFERTISANNPENIAVIRDQNFPPKAHFSLTQPPSFMDFLEEMNIPEPEVDVAQVEEIGDWNSEMVADVEPETGFEESVDAGTASATVQEDSYASDIEAVFPSPYDHIVSGGRLLMFFPVDLPSLDKLGKSSLMLPFDPLLDFQPPSTHRGRSSVTFNKE